MSIPTTIKVINDKDKTFYNKHQKCSYQNFEFKMINNSCKNIWCWSLHHLSYLLTQLVCLNNFFPSCNDLNYFKNYIQKQDYCMDYKNKIEI